MGIQHVNAARVDEIKFMLLNTQLNRPIKIMSEPLSLSFYADAVSETQESSLFYDMQEFRFLANDFNTTSLSVKNRKYEVYVNIGEWGYATRIPDSHICLGTRPQKFGSSYFSQLELSQAVEDNQYVYIIKNLSKLAGEGAMSRLNKGAGTKEQKRNRREQLKMMLGFKTIMFEKHEWLCIYRFKLEDLEDDKKHSDLLHGFLSSFLTHAFAVEEIIVTDR